MSNKKIAVIKLIVLLSIIIILPIILYFTCKDTLFNLEWLKKLPALLSNNRIAAMLIFVLLQALQVIICILPGQPIQFAASYMFGVIGGYIISIVGAIIGATIAFYLAKFLGADAIKILFGHEKVENYKRKINSGKGLLITLIVYLIPGLPKDLVGYVAGISNMTLLTFLIISSVGRTPGMLGSLLFGSFFEQKNTTAIVVLAAICAIILLLCWTYRNKLISLMDRIEAEDKEIEEKFHGKKASK